MTHAAARIIRDEHVAVTAVLRALQTLVHEGPDDEPERYFDVLRAIMFYLDEFPERRHHPSESKLLFPKLLRARPDLAPVIRLLDAQHAHGEERVRELQHLLLAWELIGETRRAPFVTAVGRYVDFYIDHMRTEETELLPIAESVLSEQDWAALDKAFRAGRDPLAGGSRDPNYDRLFARILLATPALKSRVTQAGAKPPGVARPQDGPSGWHEPHAQAA